MMGKKTLREVKAEVAALLSELPGRSPRAWLDREMESAKGDRDRDVETLEMLCAALKREAKKVQKSKARRKPVKL